MNEEQKNNLRLVLASQSPRRKKLLSYLEVPFEVIPSKVDEIMNTSILPEELVCNLAYQKAEDVYKRLDDLNVVCVGADTIVVHNGIILGKPKDRNEGRQHLEKLSSSTHSVFTGVSIKYRDSFKQFYQKTKVTFGEIGPLQLGLYLDSGEYADKAGAYGIQGSGLLFIEKIEGSYSNVVGFPLHEFYNELLLFLHLDKNEWRTSFL